MKRGPFLPPFLLVLFVGVLGTGCPPPEPECGNGVVEEGEDEQTCCVDTGCALGECTADGACKQPWVTACEDAGEGECLPDSSLVCGAESGAVPRSDCTQCGCAGEDRCEDQVCVDVDTRDAERPGPLPPNDLETPDFFALIAAVNTMESTLGDTIADHRRRVRADRRADVHVVGRVGQTVGTTSDNRVDEASGLEAQVVAHYLDALVTFDENTTVAVQDGFSPAPLATGDARVTPLPAALESACADVEPLVRSALEQEEPAVVIADAAVAHRESCVSPALFPVCTHPHLDGCIERSGAQPTSVFIMSTALVLDRLERALLIRIGNQQAFAIDGRLEQTITQWLDLVSNLARPARYRVDLDDGTPVYVRGRPMQSREGTVFLVVEDREPWGLSAFRLLWNDAPSQAFFVEQDITASDCVYFRTDDLVTFDCEDNGARLFAEIDMPTRTIVTNDRTPSPP